MSNEIQINYLENEIHFDGTTYRCASGSDLDALTAGVMAGILQPVGIPVRDSGGATHEITAVHNIDASGHEVYVWQMPNYEFRHVDVTDDLRHYAKYLTHCCNTCGCHDKFVVICKECGTEVKP